MNLRKFLEDVKLHDEPVQINVSEATFMVAFSNRSGQQFTIDLQVILDFIRFLADNESQCRDAWSRGGKAAGGAYDKYEEKSYRAIYELTKDVKSLRTIAAHGGSQTYGLTSVISQVISFFAKESSHPYHGIKLHTGFFSLAKVARRNIPTTFHEMERALNAGRSPDDVLKPQTLLMHTREAGSGELRDRVLSKPFVLLAGISGTGKTRFVREQARLSGPLEAAYPLANYELVCVRPDWHEPSDLFGYVTRLAGERFVVTPFLRFMVNAWREAVAVPETLELKPLGQITTFWLCLDEMNLAPVEQYFADFLSIMETRRWTEGVYACDPILPVHKLGLSADTLDVLRKDLGFDGDNALWKRFLEFGIPIPPNLVVVGTVNMDETTHGFSRKVIDRAITLDFGVFFPNEFDRFFTPTVEHVRLQFPRRASVTEADLQTVIADPGGAKSIAFLGKVNSVLTGTPFQLAFRALNELLLSLHSFAPESEAELYAVWDDFVMSKVLPRIEGDGEKLAAKSGGNQPESILTKLAGELKAHGLLESTERPDLYRLAGGSPVTVRMRSPEVLARMQGRLMAHGFTSFWP
jgi:hypothetical protein